MSKSGGILTEQMIVEATERAITRGGSYIRGPISADVYRRVIRAIEAGAPPPPYGFDGTFDAQFWLMKWEKK